ncbi:hypothetical protein KV097_12145 [Mumia sp. zg.B17]|uniref:hypothetical protein n=1 Tax=Mumia sp. zg.B17 TaxID=2855446 RepID=UPI001C6E1805|nr:hypothetical protein [Mumia sp. zg.B17]MBW9206694.1 hypothetical protein [Mumia sp. zg.B17]
MSIDPATAARDAHRAAAHRLKLLNDPHRPLPTEVFDDTVSIGAGDLAYDLDDLVRLGGAGVFTPPKRLSHGRVAPRPQLPRPFAATS